MTKIKINCKINKIKNIKREYDNTFWKKIVALALTTILVVSTLTGCAKKDYTNDAEQLVKFNKSMEKVMSDVSYTDAEALKDAADSLEKKIEKLELKTEEGNDLKEDYEDVAKALKDTAKLIEQYKNKEIKYSEYKEKAEEIQEKMQKTIKNGEDHAEDFYDACEDAKIEDDLLDDVEDEVCE